MIVLAILGIFQAVILPGLVLTLWVTRDMRLSWSNKLILSTPIAIVLNYLIVTTLTYTDTYSQLVIICIIIFELFIILFYFYKKNNINNLILNFSDNNKNSIQINVLSLLNLFPILILLFIYLTMGGWSVFLEWDSVVSWNRWAKEWFDQKLNGSMGYPPGLPILYSLVYKATGNRDLQIFAKLVASYFPFFGVFCLIKTGSLNKEYKYTSIITAFIYILILANGYSGARFIFSGYSDPIMASLGCFSLYFILFLINFNKNNEFKFNTQFTILLILSLVSPALIKLSGVMLSAVTIFIGIIILRKKINLYSVNFLLIITFSVSLTIHWYIYSYLRWNDYYISSDLIPANILDRLANASKLTYKICGTFISVIFFIGLLKKEIRQLATFYLLPLWLFWALLVSYDFRTAFYIIPIFSLICAFGFERVFVSTYTFVKIKFNLTANTIKRFLLIIFFITIPIICVVFIIQVPANKVILYNEKKLIKANDQGFNIELMKIFEESSLNEKTLSCWQMLYSLPGAETKFIPWGDCNLGHLRWLSDNKIKYFIYWESIVRPPFSSEDVRVAAKKANIAFKEKKLTDGDGFILFEKINN